MSDKKELFTSMKYLLSNLPSSFLLEHQIARLESLLKDLVEHVKRDPSMEIPNLFDQVLVIKKITRLLDLHFFIKESFPKELVILRKLRTCLCSFTLSKQFEDLFKQLCGLVLQGTVRSKFSDAFLNQMLSPEKDDELIAKDAQRTVEAFLELSLNRILPKSSLLSTLESVQQDFKADVDALAVPISSFSVFKRKSFKKLLLLVDRTLMSVQRNILLTPSLKTDKKTGKTKMIKKIQSPLKITDLTKFDVNQGEFGTALYQPPLDKKARRQSRQLGLPVSEPLKVMIQKIDTEKLKSLSSLKILALGHELRLHEMNTEEKSDAYCWVKYFGHFLDESTMSLFLVAESFQHSLAESLSNEEFLTAKDVIHLGESLSKALGNLHSMALVHGDVRPENILYRSKGFNGQIKLANFHHSLTDIEQEEDKSNVVAYRPPERVLDNKQERDLNFTGDVYSLSIVMWQVMHPGLLPYSFKDSSVDEIREDILNNLKPIVRYQRHCKMIVAKDERFDESQWRLLEESLEAMWMKESKDRPLIEVVYHMFSVFYNQEDSQENSEDQQKQYRQSVQVLSRRRDDDFQKDPAENLRDMLEVGPAPPPRLRKSSWLSKEEMDSRQGSYFSVERTSRTPNMYPMPLPQTPILALNKGRDKKHDSAKSPVHAMQPNEVAAHHQSDGSELVGKDNKSMLEIRDELEEFANGLKAVGIQIPAHDFSLEETTKECFIHGLELFHYKMKGKYKVGLKRFDEMASKHESGTGTERNVGSTLARRNRRVRNASKDSKGLGDMVEYLRTQKTKKPIGFIKRLASKVTRRKSRKRQSKKDAKG